jgi:hypothetical protein
MYVELLVAWIASPKHDFAQNGRFLKGLDKKKKVHESVYCLCLKIHAYV